MTQPVSSAPLAISCSSIAKHSRLIDKSEAAATWMTWSDDTHFLFVSGQEGQPRELRLGQVEWESPLIDPFNGEGAYYQVRQEEQDVIVP